MQTSYNSMALRGHDFSDDEFQSEMAEVGINIPSELLYTPRMNDFVLGEMNTQTVNDILRSGDNNPDTNMPWTPKEAQAYADRHTMDSKRVLDNLCKMKHG